MAFVSPKSARRLVFQRIASLLPLRFVSTQTIYFSPSRRKLGFRFFGVRCGARRVAMVAELRPAVKDRIDLTENEETIFRRLLDVVDHFKLNTQLRVAGGWVRDKLLGKDCYDIDIALDNMLGREFCEKLNEYLLSAGEEQRGIGVIQCNPDQSKHLETARMCIYNTWIDFVNLRSESYAENSRIPKMKFGTAEEDAYRRDLTINSLFFNINTYSVEDLTGRGVQDLKDGYIVTPLPPRATFLDDPLRVLRAIRFGARFNFKLDEDLKEAASDEEVRDALMSKISRERIGHEIDLMISGNQQPVSAMFHICDLQLFNAVFTLPENAQPEIFEGCNRLCVSYMDAAWNVLQLVGCSTFSGEQKRLYLYGALFLPLRNTVYTDNKSKKIPVANFIIRNSLKLKANDAEMVVSLHDAVERFISLFPILESDRELIPADVKIEDDFLDIPPASRKRVLAGLLLREIKSFWRVALLMSTLLHPIDATVSDSGNKESERREIFTKVERSITDLGLDNVWEVKPLLDGKAIMNVLQLKSGGPLIREWQRRMIKWQLAHPYATAEECLDWMQQSQTKRAKLDCCA